MILINEQDQKCIGQQTGNRNVVRVNSLACLMPISCCGMAARSRAMVSHARGPEFDSASGLHPPCHSRNAVAWSYTSRL